MQNQIKAPRSGLVKSVSAAVRKKKKLRSRVPHDRPLPAQKGASVQEADTLVEFYPASETRVFAPVAGTITSVESIDARPAPRR